MRRRARRRPSTLSPTLSSADEQVITGSARGGAGSPRPFGDHQLVVLAPHLDDAVLSLGGTLAAAGRHARRPRMVTVYTAGPPIQLQPPRLRAFGDYVARRAEDAAAARVLQVDAEWCGFTERVWRLSRPRLRQAFHTPRSVAGLALVDDVRRTIRTILSDPDVVLLVPLGIGGHADHVEVAVAGLQEAGDPAARGRIGFYEDFYAVSERMRRRHEIVRRVDRSSRRAATRVTGATVLADALLSRVPRGPGPLTLYPAASTLRWVPEVLPVDAECVAAKLAAVQAYRSQVQALGQLARHLPAVLRRQLSDVGGERVWWPVRGEGGPC